MYRRNTFEENEVYPDADRKPNVKVSCSCGGCCTVIMAFFLFAFLLSCCGCGWAERFIDRTIGKIHVLFTGR